MKIEELQTVVPTSNMGPYEQTQQLSVGGCRASFYVV